MSASSRLQEEYALSASSWHRSATVSPRSYSVHVGGEKGRSSYEGFTADLHKQMTKAMSQHSLGALDPAGFLGVDEETRCGWISPLGPIWGENNAPLTHSIDTQTIKGVVVRMRLELRKVPAQILQAVYRERLQNQDAKKKIDRKALKDRVASELRAKTLPRIFFADAIFYTSHDNLGLWLFAPSKRVSEHFEVLFQKTFPTSPLAFALKNVSIRPPTKKSRIEVELASLVPSVFAEIPRHA